MGHHHITEVKTEKFEFTMRSKAVVGAIFVIGLILTFIGLGQIKSDHTGSDEKKEAEKTEEHAVNKSEVPVHAVGYQEGHHEASAEEHGEASEEHAEEAHGDGHGAEAHEPWLVRVWANLLLNSYYFMLFGIAALFFIAVNYAANAGWGTLLKRIAEAMSSYLIIGVVILVAVMYFGKDYLYHWIEYFDGVKEGSIAEGSDPILEKKDWFLNKGWFLVGVPVIFAVWLVFRTVLVRFSHKEDQEGGVKFFKKSITFSAAFLVVFAFSFSMMSWLVMMSIDPHWYSTIYSVYNFAIAFVTGMTVLCFFTLYLKSKGYMEVVSDEVIHDVGKFMFAFSIFWAYIWLSQFLLIWYANISEEGIYYFQRLVEYDAMYKPMFRLNIILCFALPFLILMMRNAKRNPRVLFIAGSIILIGHWLDLYLMIMPGTLKGEAGIGLFEIGVTMTFAGLFIFWVLQNLSRKNLYPVNHPYLLESANHDVGV